MATPTEKKSWKGLFSYLETKPDYDDIDFKNRHFDALVDVSIHELQHLMISGIQGSGKTIKIYALMASILKTKDIYAIKSAIYEEDRKEIHYRYSPYHIEFSPLDLSSYESIFVMGFLKEYVKSRNVGHDIPKIVYIKNAEHLSHKSNKALGIMLEKNIDSARFIFECQSTTPFLESLRGRCVRIRVPYPKEDDIDRAMIRLAKKFDNRDLTKSEMERAKEMNSYFGPNMKHIFGSLHTYMITGEWVKLASAMKMDILVDFVLEEENWTKTSSYERIREMVQELYIDLIPFDHVMRYLIKRIIKKYPKEEEMMHQMIAYSAFYDKNMKRGNKPTLHLEAFILHILEILIQKFGKKTFNIK